MKQFKKTAYLVASLLIGGLLGACKDEPTVQPQPASTFARGADVSWITQMEAAGRRFYNVAGVEMDGMRLLKQLGMDAIRLRVWVDPENGWCGKGDFLVKARRAHQLGMRLMVNFHYSDTWADPGQQRLPAAWEGKDLEGLKAAVASHTIDILNALKDIGIAPEWVQVGNETGNGMLWERGKASINMANYAALHNAGYDAVKSIFPDAKVIVHLQRGDDNSLFRWLFDGLKANGGKWDVIGMSLYPSPDDWREMNEKCMANMKDMLSRHASAVMICEVGMSWDEAPTAKLFLDDLMTKSRTLPADRSLGVFYWEPQSYGGWNGYTLGAFDNAGRPTEALDAFRH